KTEPLRREMSVHDLLRHTSGLTYAHLAGPLLKSHYEGAGVVDEKQTNAEMVGKLGRLPLAYQPGTTWQYGVSIGERHGARPLHRGAHLQAARSVQHRLWPNRRGSGGPAAD